MKWLHRNVGAAQSALEQPPEVLDPLSVNLAANVLFDVSSRSHGHNRLLPDRHSHPPSV